jgi:acyl carrier protein
MGRKDFQVKIRGYRVELGEIESCLLEYPDVTKTVVIDRLDAANKKYLIAYIVADQEVAHQDLRKHLGEKLPEYMIPSYFVSIDEIPLTANGKIDRKALPEPDYDAIAEEDHVAPRDEIERELALIWQELLNLPKVGITDDFFESGGDSLKAATLVSRIHERLGVRIRLTEVFKSSTIEALAGALRSFTDHEHYIPIPEAGELEHYAATSPQRGFYVMQQVDPGNLSYHMPTIAFELHGELDRERIEKAFVDLIARQESLRTSIELVDETPVQNVHGEVPFAIESFEVAGLDPEEERKKVREIIKAFVRPFDLATAPLFRAALIKFEEERHLLVIDIHHIITDGSSMILFMAQFLMLYRGEELPPLRIQHKDFAQWQMSEAGRQEMEKQERFWLEEYKGEVKSFDLPTDFARPKVQTFDGSLVVFDLEEEQVKALKQLALDREATLFMVLLSIFTIFLSKISQQEEVLVSMPVANRRHSDLQQVVGMFVNTLVVRNFPEKDKTFAGYLQDTRKKTLSSFDNQSYPLEELVSNLNLKRDAGRSPLTDTMFVMHNVDIPMVEMPGITIKRYFAPQEHTQRDLTLAVASRANQLNISFQYNINLFKHETIERYAGYFREILGIVLENPDIRIADIHVDHSMLSAGSGAGDVDLGFADEMN